MRAVMGDMDLDHTLSQRDQINAKLRLILDEATDKWGVKVTRVDCEEHHASGRCPRHDGETNDC
jgi:regulator of protease activity HflC (stomatin/prohibitin superfamily)